MSREQKWEGAVEMVEFTGRVLKDAIKAAHHEASGHVPSLTQAISFSRSAFIEAQEFERLCFEKMNEPEEPEVDPNQMQIAASEYRNTTGAAIVATDDVTGNRTRLEPGETFLVVDTSKVSFILAGVQATAAQPVVTLVPAAL